MASCIKSQFSISMLMFVSSLFAIFGGGYYFKGDNAKLAYLLVFIGLVVFICGLVICLNSVLAHVPKVGEAENAFKRVRFSSLLQVYEDVNHGLELGSPEKPEDAQKGRNDSDGNCSDRHKDIKMRGKGEDKLETVPKRDIQETATDECSDINRPSEICSCVRETKSLLEIDAYLRNASGLRNRGDNQRVGRDHEDKLETVSKTDMQETATEESSEIDRSEMYSCVRERKSLLEIDACLRNASGLRNLGDNHRVGREREDKLETVPKTDVRGTATEESSKIDRLSEMYSCVRERKSLLEIDADLRNASSLRYLSVNQRAVREQDDQLETCEGISNQDEEETIFHFEENGGF